MDDSLSLDAKLLAETNQGDNAPPLSVSEISGSLKRVVEDRFGYVRIRGEISGYKRAASGHVYLALKDDKAVLDGVMWKGNAGRLAFAPEDGIEVVVSGKLTTYPGRSKYQVVIDKMELAGEGALMQLFEKLKAKLAGEGLFDADRKRAIPFLPKTIGVVTSPTGSVIRDILHRLADRCPSHVIVWPVLVQGEGAAKQIAAAINGFSNMPEDGAAERPDLVIVARGGGSIEDLWSFNEEEVVRAVANCSIPLISAVGHETDTTLCDFAADLRAPTPTAAAEMAVPVRAEWLASLSESKARMARSVQRGLSTAQERLEAQRRLMPALTDLLRPHQQRLDELSEAMKYALGQAISSARSRFSLSDGALKPAVLRRYHDRAMERLEAVKLSPALLTKRVGEAAQRLDGLARLLNQVSPDGPLKRGYARVSSARGQFIGSREDALFAGAVNLHFHDGTVDAEIVGAAVQTSRPRVAPDNPLVTEKQASQPAAKPKRVKKPADDRQQDLF
ncbi:exodeoxyribonuclease VII large subunit [Parasphingorhabdus halotolerans]|uniref:Exodeoxyribonuclease 7 large subunit n=1 Tax=Parasphingorhabdus halotolerans TaxID=2725558 RepID=A0A6H2DL92_9SPHN|nr:exodeoxyribonuclease VII large subunit [Parasphingorhabdus halotolerans]QJB69114.1 exodeoxyribonuclease VII large subunit [Parasphingorhabdus halotolerans]